MTNGIKTLPNKKKLFTIVNDKSDNFFLQKTGLMKKIKLFLCFNEQKRHFKEQKRRPKPVYCNYFLDRNVGALTKSQLMKIKPVGIHVLILYLIRNKYGLQF
jgi:hypothetical protein